MDTQDSTVSSNDTKSEPCDEWKSIITALMNSTDSVAALSEFYMTYIEGGPERHNERTELRRSSPLYQLYSRKADEDKDRYLETLGRHLKKVVIGILGNLGFSKISNSHSA